MPSAMCRPDLRNPWPRWYLKPLGLYWFCFLRPPLGFHSDCISVQPWMAGLVIGKALPCRQWPWAELGLRFSYKQMGADLQCLFNSVSHIWKPLKEQTSQMSWAPCFLQPRMQMGLGVSLCISRFFLMPAQGPHTQVWMWGVATQTFVHIWCIKISTDRFKVKLN